ncbi:MAG: TylF/MycF/NovP-related O-methyltransferase [Enterocloster sp.]
MKTIVILGAGQFGRRIAGMLNTNELTLLSFGDNNPALWNTCYDHPVLGPVPVRSIREALAEGPDCALTGVIDPERSFQLQRQAQELGFRGAFLSLHDFYRQFDIRSAVLNFLAERIKAGKIAGSVAELGVYKGDLAWKLNALFPDRRLYLFDTFEGFDPRDVSCEISGHFSRASEGDFSDTSVSYVLSRLPYPDNAVIRKGYFPDTAAGLEEQRYALVSLDADLYAPILAGLSYFYPRLSRGGMILLHDYNNQRFRGAKEAVEAYEAEFGILPLVPLCDLHGSAVIIKP